MVVALAASIPFFVEGRFGILGTGLNPDMSQHLFAADRLAHGDGGRLISQGYPLGPHALVVAASTVTGAAWCTASTGSCWRSRCARRSRRWRSWTGSRRGGGSSAALLVALAYLVASYLIQGAFKETMEALFVLAFAIGLHELGRGALIAGGRAETGLRRALAAVPLAALAVGSVYAYSFPGLALARRRGRGCGPRSSSPSWRGPSSAGGGARARPARRPRPRRWRSPPCASPCAPEIGRMVDFASFETFNPSGPGLGNLFNPISPLEALGIWPSGDFRLDPGDGAVPAVGFYLGELLGLAGPRLRPRLVALAPRAGGPGRRSPWPPRCSPTRTSRAPPTRPRSRS